jgi:hypothetical protein
LGCLLIDHGVAYPQYFSQLFAFPVICDFGFVSFFFSHFFYFFLFFSYLFLISFYLFSLGSWKTCLSFHIKRGNARLALGEIASLTRGAGALLLPALMRCHDFQSRDETITIPAERLGF